jgi:transposase
MDPAGYDAGKMVKSRRAYALVDVEGLPLRVIVTSRGHPGSRRLSPRSRQDSPALSMVGAGLGRLRLQVKDAVAGSPDSGLEITKRTDDRKGFIAPSRRWVVERTFSWFGRNRRLAKDYENLAETLTAFVTLAATRRHRRALAIAPKGDCPRTIFRDNNEKLVCYIRGLAQRGPVNR